MEQITREEAVNTIHKTKNSIFTVTFVKKDGSLRKMNCRKGVKKYLKGSGKPSTTHHIPKYITVFDMVKKGYRTINVTTIQALNIAGQSYEVAQC